jgi:ABC-type spermidine/putrescine transport system permease subunit I
MLVLGYVWLPFVALPIFVTLESLDRGLLEAASDLYASRLQAFVRVTLPLSAPGLVAAFLFVFIPTVGEFVTPSLVGGTSGYMYGNQIVDLFGTASPTGRRVGARALPARGGRGPDLVFLVFVRFLRTAEARTPDGRRALPNGKRLMRVFFALVIVLPLRADRDPPRLLVQQLCASRSSRSAASRCRWYRDFLTNGDMQAALETSAIIAAGLERGAVALGILASIGLTRRRFRGKLGVTALLLSPLVIPLLVLGVSLLLLFHELGCRARL